MAQSQPRSHPRVAAIVLNSVSHDTRVLKEAATLREAGYEVTIFGIRDNRCNEPHTLLPDGTRIIRCAWRSKALQWIARVLLAGGVIGLLLLGMLYWLWIEPIALWFTNAMTGGVTVKVISLLAILAIGAGFLHRFIRRLRRMAKHYAVQDTPRPTDGSAPTEHSPPSAPAYPIRTTVTWLLSFVSKSITELVRRRELLRAMAEFKPNIVHCHDLSALPLGCAYSSHHRIAVVYDSHEIFEAVSMISWHRRRWSEWIQRWHSRRVDLFITINQSIADYLGNKYPKLPPAVVVKNAGRPLTEPLNYNGRLHDVAELDRSTRVLLYQGGFSRFRGLSILVQAAPLLPEGWVLVMMGWGTLEKELKDLARTVDPAGKRVRFIPGAPLAELAQWTAGGTVGVIPYENVCLNHWYCTPNKLWEYPLAGVPILASGFPEMRKMIESHGIGRLLPDPLTPRDIAGAVAALDDESLAAMRANCASFIAEDNWSLYASRLVKAYQSLAGIDQPYAAPAATSTASAAECSPSTATIRVSS